MFACHSDWRIKIGANIYFTAFIHSMTHQQFKFNHTQVMEAMARKEAGESPNKRPAQSQAQVRWFTIIVHVSIYHFFLSDPCFAGFPRQPGQKIQMQLKYSHPASKLDQQQFFPLSKATYFGKSVPWSTVEHSWPNSITSENRNLNLSVPHTVRLTVWYCTTHSASQDLYNVSKPAAWSRVPELRQNSKLAF